MTLKIGVCVSGQMRSVESWNTLKPYLSKDGRTSKTYLHTWYQPETTRVFRFFDHKLGNWSPLVSSNSEAAKTIQPTNYLIEHNITEVVDPCVGVGPGDVTRHRVLSMWRGQYKACELAVKNDNFDVMCRTRSDLVFETDPFEFLNGNAPPEGVVYVPEGPNGGEPEAPPTEALHDWFGVAEPKTFVKFVSLYQHACEYFKEKPTLFPEVMLKHHVDRMGLTIVRYPLKYYIKRV